MTLDLAPRFKIYVVTRSGLRIGEIAERAGVSVDTVRYYERRKPLPRATRSEGGFRLFTTDAINRVLFIRQAQDIGFSLDEIRMLVAGGGADECRQIRDLLRSKLSETDQWIRALRAFNRTLRRHLRACEGELARRGGHLKLPGRT